MPPKTRIQIARSDIIRFFEESPLKVFKYGDLAGILQDHREFWRLTQAFTTNEFIKFLIDSGDMRRLSFPFPHRSEIRYAWGHVPVIQVLNALKEHSYFCHYTAVRAHGLTEQVPKVLYINHEQVPKPFRDRSLSQDRINRAFASSPRVTNNIATMGDYRVFMLNGMHTGLLGVVEAKLPDIESGSAAYVNVTDLERTLIDIAVRPFYAGGVFEVLNAYKASNGEASVNRIAAMLKQLDFIYPYHQVIGYYLERSGVYKESAIELLRRIPREFEFYLMNKTPNPVHVPEWRLYVPQGLYLGS